MILVFPISHHRSGQTPREQSRRPLVKSIFLPCTGPFLICHLRLFLIISMFFRVLVVIFLQKKIPETRLLQRFLYLLGSTCIPLFLPALPTRILPPTNFLRRPPCRLLLLL